MNLKIFEVLNTYLVIFKNIVVTVGGVNLAVYYLSSRFYKRNTVDKFGSKARVKKLGNGENSDPHLKTHMYQQAYPQSPITRL